MLLEEEEEEEEEEEKKKKEKKKKKKKKIGQGYLSQPTTFSGNIPRMPSAYFDIVTAVGPSLP